MNKRHNGKEEIPESDSVPGVNREAKPLVVSAPVTWRTKPPPGYFVAEGRTGKWQLMRLPVPVKTLSWQEYQEKMRGGIDLWKT